MGGNGQQGTKAESITRIQESAAAGWCQAVIVSVRLCYSFIIKVSDRDETSAQPTHATCPDIDRRTVQS